MPIRDYLINQETDPLRRQRVEQLLDWADDKPEMLAIAEKAFRHNGRPTGVSSPPEGDTTRYSRKDDVVYLDFAEFDRGLYYAGPDGKPLRVRPERALAHELTHAGQDRFAQVPQAVAEIHAVTHAVQDSAEWRQLCDRQRAIEARLPEVTREESLGLIAEDKKIIVQQIELNRRFFDRLDRQPHVHAMYNEMESPAIASENKVMHRYFSEPEITTDYAARSFSAARADLEHRADALDHRAFPLNPRPSGDPCLLPPATLQQINQQGRTLASLQIRETDDLSGCRITASDALPGNAEYDEAFRRRPGGRHDR